MRATPGDTSHDPLRRIVFHADDFGMNRSVTDGILQGFEQGLLTSTSALANAPDVLRALGLWKRLEQNRAGGHLPSSQSRTRLDDPGQAFDLGVHLNLTQGRPLSGERYPAELLDDQGRFPGIFGLFGRLRHGGARFAAALEAELTQQIQKVLDGGCRPVHLNGHQYVEMIPVVAGIVPSLLKKFQIPVVRVPLERCWFTAMLWLDTSMVRWLVAGVQMIYARRFRSQMAGLGVSFPDAFFGTLTAGNTDLRKLGDFLRTAGPFRLAEIAVHPAALSPTVLPSDDKCPVSEVRSQTNAPSPPAPLPQAGEGRHEKTSETGYEDGWHDPLAQLRPQELRLLLSDELVEHLHHQGVRLGRLAIS